MGPVFNRRRDTAVCILRIKSLQGHEGKTSGVLIAFIIYVNDLKILQRSKVSVKITTIFFNAILTLLIIVRVAIRRLSWLSCFMRAALFIMRATNRLLCLLCFVDFTLHPSPQIKI